jgi:hypothetical protein
MKKTKKRNSGVVPPSTSASAAAEYTVDMKKKATASAATAHETATHTDSYVSRKFTTCSACALLTLTQFEP